MNIPFPEVIDASMLSAFRSCPQKWFREYLQHWKPQTDSVHLHAGKAFAEGLEVARRAFYESGESESDAVAMGAAALMHTYGDFECPPDSAKSLERMLGAFEFYFANYPMASDAAKPIVMPSGKLAVEFSFAQPLPVLHPVTGNPLIYSGRSDMIAEFAGGTYIYDDKTASQLGASWSKQWDMRSQFTGYCWAAQEIGLKVSGVLVRGVSILKTKYDTANAVTYRAQFEIDRWLAVTTRNLNEMISMWEHYIDRVEDESFGVPPHDPAVFRHSLDHACNEYGGCGFTRICKSPEPETWLPMYFQRKRWDPLTRTETVLGDDE